MTPAARQAGYSLLEVLVAFAIAAAALTVIFGSAARAVAAAVHSRDLASAATLASSLYAETGSGAAASIAERPGSEGTRFKWRVSTRPRAVSRAQDPRAGLDLHDVRVEVSWMERGRAQTYELSGVKPVASDAR